MKKVVFFFPWTTVSGGPYYLCRLADDLAATGKYEVYYTDYYNGLSDKILNDFRVRKYPYFGKAFDMEIFCKEPIVLITPIYWTFVVPKLHPDSKILYINWHNACIEDIRMKWKTDSGTIERFLELVQDKQGVFFADKAHLLAQNSSTGFFYNETIVPIITEARERIASRQVISEEEYNVAILGRMSPDKVYADIDLIENIAALPPDGKIINIHIIGNGPQENLLFNRNYPEHINIIKYGTLPIEKVISVLADKVDILFAMGTSALEGASIGLPTVIIPNETKPFHCNKYAFIYQSVGFALGWAVKQIEELGIEYTEVKEIFNQIYLYDQKAAIGQACYEYVRKNHLSNVAFLESAISLCDFRYRALHPLIRPDAVAVTNGQKPVAAIEKFEQCKKAITRFKRIIGKPVKRFCLFGFPVVALTKVDAQSFNFFLCCVPFFRIKKIQKSYSLNLLLVVWTGKTIKKIIEKISAPLKEENTVACVQTDNRLLHRQRIESKLAKNEKIRVCLFEARISCWQFGNLYHLLENSGIFEPVVVVIPFLTMGDDAMNEYMDTTYAALKKQGYRVVKGYDKETETFLDIRKELDPDAVFYSMFWKNHFQANSYINKFEDIYTFLYPYGYDIVSHPDRESMNFELQKKVSRYYLPTKIHKGIAEDNMDNHAENVYITGSPKLDYLLDPNYKPNDVWMTIPGKKRVIWAPHHTLEESLPHAQLCAFLDLSEYMLELAAEYVDTIHFAFKPHPMLKPRLYKRWGKRKTDEYYAAWESGANTQIENGEFVDLFLTSDAMILDSISFIGEYTIINKPAFFTYGKDTRFPLNRFGKAIIKVLYKNQTTDTLLEDIKTFIDDVVLRGEDTKKEERTAFVEQFMLPENNKTAAENIYEDMCRVILKDELVEYKIDWSSTFGGNK